MNARILLALSHRLNRPLSASVTEALRSHFGVGQDVEILPVSTATDALALGRSGDDIDLLITHVDLPADRHSVPLPDERRGLDLVQQLRQAGRSAPAVLLVGAEDPIVTEAVLAMKGCALVVVKSDLEESLKVALRGLLAHPAGTGPAVPSFADIEIHLRRSFFRVNAYSPTQTLQLREPLSLLRADVLCLADHNADILQFDYPLWARILREIGQKLLRRLFEDARFKNAFIQALVIAGDLRNLRIRFVVDNDDHSVALEALNFPADIVALIGEELKQRELPIPAHLEGRFWMLDTSVIRNLRSYDRFNPIMNGWQSMESPINCLIIEADACGFVPGTGYLPRLKNVAEECDELERMINVHRQSEDKPLFNKPRRLSKATLPAGVSFADHLRDTLRDGTTWHFIHFSGHSFVDQDGEDAMLFLPGDQIETVPLDDFGSWLESVTFVYLGSCRNAGDKFMLDLARGYDVRAVLGFRWAIDDERAAEHSKIFYRELLSGGSIERAFVRARETLHGRWEYDRVWAAPMLILQGEHLLPDRLNGRGDRGSGMESSLQ
jgi:CheY-like chemotaxis protein